jgi:hypothetical protein
VGGTSLLGVVACCVLVAGSRGFSVERWPLLLVVLAWSAAAVGLAWAAARLLSPRATVIGGLLLAAGLQGVGMAGGPQMSDDLYRYVWDARVAAAGIDPYAHPPVADELRAVRTPDLWHDDATCLTRPAERDRWDRSSPFVGLGGDTGCTSINRREVRTIYPPAAQLAFRASYALTPGLPIELRVELPMALVSLTLSGLLMRLRLRSGHHPGAVLAYAVGPLAVVECGMDGHIDVLAALVAVLCLLAATSPRLGERGRGAVVGGLLAVATLIKLYPALLALPLLARLGWRSAATWVAAGAGLVTAAALYAPHVADSGLDVIGFLPGYLRENDYGGGSNFQVLNLLLPDGWTTAPALLLLLAIAVWCVRTPVRTRDELAVRAATTVGLVLLVVTPGTPWYYVLLVALALLADRPEWQVLTAAAYVAYFVALQPGSPLLSQAAYGAAALVVLGASRRRAGAVIRM